MASKDEQSLNGRSILSRKSSSGELMHSH